MKTRPSSFSLPASSRSSTSRPSTNSPAPSSPAPVYPTARSRSWSTADDPAPCRQSTSLTQADRARLVGTCTDGKTVIIDQKDGQLVGADGGTWTKLGAHRDQRRASGHTPATEFIFSTGLDGQGAYLTQGSRSLRRVDRSYRPHPYFSSGPSSGQQSVSRRDS